MKFLHTSDLHIGKKLQGFSLADDQRHILNEIVKIAKAESVDGILVAGDIYDSSTPTEESFRIYDEFLTEASDVCDVYIIAGNHDSEGRLGVGGSVMDKAGVHVTKPYHGIAEKVSLRDGYGDLDVFLMPYVSKTAASTYYADKGIKIDTPDAAVKTTLDRSGIDPKKRNILVAHQHFAAVGMDLEQSGSETDRLDIGNTKTISAELLKDFDYCALGHIHKPQSAGVKNAVYCGTPMKYDYSERNDKKHVNIVEVKEKGNVEVKEVPLVPLREMVCLQGDYDEIYASLPEVPKNSMVYVTLTDRHDGDRDSITKKITSCGSVLFDLDYELNESEEFDMDAPDIKELGLRKDIDLFMDFFKSRLNKEMTPEQVQIMADLFDRAAQGDEL